MRASAQDDLLPITPIEALSCRYAEGKGPADLEGLAAGFNDWMERSEAPAYTAYVLSPLAHSEELEFDLLWIGAWPDGVTMGTSMAHYFTHGAELGPVFGAVMDCGSNTNYAVLTIKRPEQAAFGPLEVASCTLRVGAVIGDALAAVEEWVQYATRSGSGAAHWILFPAYGERSDAGYSFKWAMGYGSYESFGRDYDEFNNGGGVDQYNALFEGIMRCDSPRLYSVRPIRLEEQR
jgi:hypothetical protein